ncbi:MAG: type II secretion system protein [Pseudomonadales bacterium]|nr:type II secretion system protein [Pseudomonadales bacterium]MCP5302113.1 type II secretion system protein [Pseudomonadales bacterium]
MAASPNRHCEPQVRQSKKILLDHLTRVRNNSATSRSLRATGVAIHRARQQGFSLIELVVFMVVVGLALSSTILVYNQSVINSVDPIIRVQMAELAQSQLDEVIARKYDENTPTGGIPACGSAETGAPACAGMGLEAGEVLSDQSTLDDVDDFDGYNDTPYTGYTRDVAISIVGNTKQITVTVSGPNNQQLILSAFRANF